MVGNGKSRRVWDPKACALLLVDSQETVLGLIFEAYFIVDAVADSHKEEHDTAVLRLADAGAVPTTTAATMSERFRDWKPPLADVYRKVMVP